MPFYFHNIAINKGTARTQFPTTKNCAPQPTTLVEVAAVSRPECNGRPPAKRVPFVIRTSLTPSKYAHENTLRNQLMFTRKLYWLTLFNTILIAVVFILYGYLQSNEIPMNTKHNNNLFLIHRKSRYHHSLI